MDDLVTWLRAIYDERERLAREGTPFGSGRWIADAQYGDRAQVRDRDGGCVIHDDGELSLATAEHIALNDPADALADLAAKRRILDIHGTGTDPCDAHDASMRSIPCDTLLALALPHGDRPGYREEWKP